MQRIQKRRAGQRQTQNALIGLLSAVSMTRIGLTQLLPLCGSAAWWLSAACMLPGLCVYGALRLLLRRTHTRTLTDCARKLLGNFGGILIMLTLTLPLLLDGIASLTALITFFTEGIGARGSQFTLTLLTASVMLIALNRDGLPRGVYLLRHVLLVAAGIIAINALLDAHPDGIVPLLGEGVPPLLSGIRSAWGMSWMLLLLLEFPAEEGTRRPPAMFVALLPCPVILLLLSLTIPSELTVPGRSLASRLALPTLFLQPAVRTLAQCLLMMTLFLSIAGSAQLAARFLTSSCLKPKKWVPYVLIGLLTLTQLFDISRLWRVLTAFTAWSLVPGVLLLLLLTIARLCRREKA